ncbi:MAG: PilW family protein, partial [Rhodocyclaceae bacterium]|nr:PilW family protein [Rhodocyclaceae bacterium]
ARSPAGFAVDDRVVTNALAPNCSLVTVTGVAVISPTSAAISYTPALSATTTAGFLANFGPLTGGPAGSFFSRTYGVGLTSLTVGDYPAYTTSNLVDGIVFMKAQYGLSANATSSTVLQWVSGATVINSSNVDRVVALRIGVVARSTKREDGEIDQPNPLPLFDEKAATGTDAVTYAVPDLNARYRAYSTIVPLKNMIWTR